MDGIIGDSTRTAIQQYQCSRGIFPADGRAGQKFHRLIMQDSSLNNGQNRAQSRGSARQPQTYAYGQVQPASQTDNMAKLIESQSGYGRIVGADGTVRVVRMDDGAQ